MVRSTTVRKALKSNNADIVSQKNIRLVLQSAASLGGGWHIHGNVKAYVFKYRKG